MALLSLLALLVAAAPDVYPHNCTYKQGGTGSVTRACADKLADALAAKEFGAKCDGVTDDAPALALANTAAVAQGKAIFIGCKLRIASAAGTVAAGLRFEGAGALDLSPVGGSVTLTGPLTAPVAQVFYTGSGTLTFSAKVAQVVPQWWGAVGDGVADDTAAIQAAITAATAAGGGTVRAPGGATYLVSQINMKTDVWINADGASFKLKAASAIGAAMFKFDTASRSGLLGAFKLDGNRANQTNTGDNGQFGVYVGPNSADIYIESGYATGFAGDSMYIGIGGQPANTTPKGVAVSRWVADQAFRNGVSITNAKNVHFGYLETRLTSGAAPQAGLDIEPNLSTDVLSGIVIDHLVTYSNTGYGVQVLGVLNGTAFAADQGYVTFGRLDSYSNTLGGMLIFKTHHVAILDGAIHDNTVDGITIQRDAQHLRVRASVYNNGQRGINGSLTTQVFTSSDWDFSGSVVRDNSQSVANTYDGIRLDSDDAAKVVTRIIGHGVRLYDDQLVMTQRFGLAGGTNVANVDFSGYIPANATAAYTAPAPIYVETAPRLYASQVFNYSTPIANGTCNAQTFTITGTATNDSVLLSPAGSFDGMTVLGVAGTNTVRVQLCNQSGGPVTPGNIRFQTTIMKH